MAKSNFNQASKFYLKVITIELQISLNLNNGRVNSSMKLAGGKKRKQQKDLKLEASDLDMLLAPQVLLEHLFTL